MAEMTRRKFIQLAASLGATLAWNPGFALESKVAWKERRDLFPQGVASGDPYPDSVLLWTRRPFPADTPAKTLTLEISDDASFRKLTATAQPTISVETDWTCRVLAGGLQPGRVYWYRFTDENGFGSRIGRTITAPTETDNRPVRFTFVSCQNVQQSGQNAYRRMIFEDEKRNPSEQLQFVLHLGDFVYEVVWYPEDRPQGMYDRRLRDIVRYPSGEKYQDMHIPTTVEDYRMLYAAYLLDPDLQDARARWPFVCMWDNHEFSWKGWQSMQNFDGVKPAQQRKVAANQAWFEYQPARVVKPGDPKEDRFVPPTVANAPLEKYDDNGLGLEPGNLAAINSLKVFRSFRFGQNVDLILTDNRSYASEPVTERAEADPFNAKDFGFAIPEDVLDILDAGKTFNGGKPPDTIRFDGQDLPNPRKTSPAGSVLGGAQKAWFFERLRASKSRWKIWGNSIGMLEWRIDVQNLPKELAIHWPSAGCGTLAGDWTGYRTERAEILNFIKNEKITGLTTVAGDRHSFFAGVLSADLPPKTYEPVAAEFITGSISAPGLLEAFSHKLPKDLPAWPLFLYEPTGGAPLQAAINLTLMHGVRSSLELQKTHDEKKALAAANPDVSPHLAFVDMGAHGYSVVTAGGETMDVEFVCIPRPIERSDRADGGPILYRVTHRVKLWDAGKAPKVERIHQEGDLPLVL